MRSSWQTALNVDLVAVRDALDQVLALTVGPVELPADPEAFVGSADGPDEQPGGTVVGDLQSLVDPATDPSLQEIAQQLYFHWRTIRTQIEDVRTGSPVPVGRPTVIYNYVDCTLVTGQPNAPAELRASASQLQKNASITLSWPASAPNGLAVTSYTIENSGGARVSCNGKTPCVVAADDRARYTLKLAATNNRTYRMNVYATNAWGHSVRVHSNSVTPTPPPPPTGGSGTACSGCAFASRSLSQGDSGPDVKELQIRVAGWVNDASRPARTIQLDGNFGGLTTQAVRGFQAAYGLPVDGVAGPSTFAVLKSLADGDGTVHFNYSEFASKDGSGFSGGRLSEAKTRENVRRLMYRLEAIRKKNGDNPMNLNSGYRSVAHNTNVNGAKNSQHMYGTASDNRTANVSNRTSRERAKATAFAGVFCYAQSTHNHFDIRANNDDDGMSNSATQDPYRKPGDSRDRDNPRQQRLCYDEDGHSGGAPLPEMANEAGFQDPDEDNVESPVDLTELGNVASGPVPF